MDDPVERQLLDGVLADPDDDAPRLVYADWLEERGDPRGEFIQLQCRLADSDPNSPIDVLIRNRSDDLRLRHGPEWAEPVRRCGIRSYEFRRGFVERVTLNVDKSLERAAHLPEVTPLREVRLRGARGHCRGLRHTTFFRNVRLLEVVGDQIGIDSLRELAHCPSLDRVQRLKVIGLYEDGTSFPQFVLDAVSLVSLRSLELPYAGLRGDDELSDLLESERGRSLELLDLSRNRLLNGGAQRIAKAGLSKLHTLRLVGASVGVGGATALADWPSTELRELDLSGNGIGDTGLGRLLDSESLCSLRRLVLSHTNIGPVSGRRLATLDRDRELSEVVVDGTALGSIWEPLVRDRFPAPAANDHP